MFNNTFITITCIDPENYFNYSFNHFSNKLYSIPYSRKKTFIQNFQNKKLKQK